jgi:alcohol dehydrogenase (cytochrome c)
LLLHRGAATSFNSYLLPSLSLSRAGHKTAVTCRDASHRHQSRGFQRDADMASSAQEETAMQKTTAFASLTGLSAMLMAGTTMAADVTYERLRNPEPQNWLMNHHDFSSQRYSPLDSINKTNVKNLKLAFTVPLGGKAGNEYIEATPLVDNGFMYITDAWGVVYKIDVRSGTQGKVLWKMDPGQQRLDRNRGVALWGNLVISVTGYDGRIIATDAESGQVVWDKKHSDNPDLEFSAAPLALKDTILIGASGGDNGVRCWLAALDPKTGELKWRTFMVPAAGEPGSETWKDKASAWQTGGGALYVTGSYDPTNNLTYWGTGNPAPRYDSAYRPGDNLFTASSVAFDAATGKMQWYFQHTANDNRDYDSAGPQILLDSKVNGEDRKLLALANRNGFNYTLDRSNGQFLKAVQYSRIVTWTKGIDPKTGKPVDYDPTKDVQNFALDWKGGSEVMKNACPDVHGGTNFWPPSYSQKTKLLYITGNEGCADIVPDPTAHVKGKFGGGNYRNEARISSGLVVVDPTSGEVKSRKEHTYPNHAGVLTTAGGIVVTALLDGTVVAYDDQTLEELWKFNTGTGFVAPPMTYAVDGKQYIAISSGLNPVARAKLARAPEMKNQSNATMLFVFALQ